jgi:hypothetical protein
MCLIGLSIPGRSCTGVEPSTSIRKRGTMSRRLILWALTGLAFSVAGCAPSLTGWRHFQGDLSGQGFLNVKSGYAVSPA